MSSILTILALCLGLSSAAVVDTSNSANSSLPLILQNLFSSPLSVNPVRFNFVPAQPNVFFLVPNQTENSAGAAQVAPSFVAPQPKQLFIPDARELNLAPVSDLSTNLVSDVASVSPQPSTSSIELLNNSLVLNNPFAAVPYQSNTETIASLIQSIFSNFSLQSLPPENLIFGSLPSPNSTITRTIVQDAFGNDQIVNFDQSSDTETTTSTDGILQPENVFPLNNANQIDSDHSEDDAVRPEEVREGNSLSAFSNVRDFSESLLTTTERPPETIAPATVTPVASTMSAEFESNRIEPIQAWSTASRVPTTLVTQSLPTVPPPTRPPTRIVSPKFVHFPISQPKFLKPTKLQKSINLYKSPLKLLRNNFPKLSANSLYSFELNNKKIVGGKPLLGQVKPIAPVPRPIVTKLPIEQKKQYSVDIDQETTQHAQSDQLSSIAPEKLQKYQKRQSSAIVSNLVNIISLPNYKFYLGKKT